MTQEHADDRAPDDKTDEASVREAKGSVHEAIGKLIGDDDARERGAAEKEAGASQTEDPADDAKTR